MIYARKLINTVPATAYAGAVLVLVTLLGVRSCQYDDIRADLAVTSAQLDTAVATNRRNEQAIEVVKTINAQCIEDREADETRHANARADWARERNQLEVQANAAREIETVEVYRTPNCVELAKMDINELCPGLADSLRERADSINAIRDSRSSGTSTDPD